MNAALNPRCIVRALLAVVLLASLLTPALTPRSAAAAAPATALQLRKVERIDNRHLALSVYSPAMGRVMGIRVLLPANYAKTTRRYPVIYLHHGGGGNETRWTYMTDIEQHTAKRDVIVVMPSAVENTPDGDVLGWFSDWYANTAGNRWESYHLNEIIPFIDATYRTIARREGRAVGGLSMGGFGALSYAARRPDLFVAAASFAGVPNSVPGDVALAGRLGGEDIWGPYATQEVRHRGHNPRDLLNNLRGVDVFLTCGYGADPALPDPQGQVDDGAHMTAIEPALLALNQEFSQALTDAGMPHVFKIREGHHGWSYWDQDVQEWLPHVMKVLAQARPVTAPPAYRSMRPAFNVWGWNVSTSARPLEFMEVRRLSRTGLIVTGSGVATFTTPRYYAPGAEFRIRQTDRAARTVRADRLGRLRIPVDLGVRHAYQQYTRDADVEQAQQGAGYFRTAIVSITKR